MQSTILGIDVSKTSINCCLLSEIPDNPKNWIRKNRPIKIQYGPGAREELLALKFDCAILEPTGVYSRIWRHWLKEAERDYRLVGHAELAHYRKGFKIESKTDRLDSFALAMYGLDRGHRPDAFVIERDFTLKDLISQYNHLNRQKNGIQNRLRQFLNWQSPANYTAHLSRQWGRQSVPKRLQALASPTPELSRWICDDDGPGISEGAKIQAQVLVAFEEAEIRLEQLIEAEMAQAKYEKYRNACNRMAFSDWFSAIAIAQAYPFERFLGPGGKPRRQHTFTQTGKRVRRDQSLRAFKLAFGQGQIFVSSGDWSGYVAGGSRETRCALFNTTRSQYLKEKSKQKRGGEIDPDFQSVKHFNDAQGFMKVSRKLVEKFYKELLREFC